MKYISHRHMVKIVLQEIKSDILTKNTESYCYVSGVCFPDKGTINVLGEDLVPGNNLLSVPYMMGYCHNSSFLIDDLTVEEHLTLFCFVRCYFI